jgi:chromosome segregation ATPase
LIERLSEVRDRNETLNNRLSLLREQTSEESLLISQLESECSEMEQRIASLDQTHSEVRGEAEGLRDRNSSLKSALGEVSRLLEEAGQQRAQLAQQVVSSPEKLRSQIVEVGHCLQGEQRDAKLAEKKVRDLSAWVVNLEEAQFEVGISLEAVQEVQGEVERQKAAINELEALRQGNSVQGAGLSELDQMVHQAKRHSVRAEEKLQHLKKQAASRGEDTQRSVDGLHRQLIDAESFRNQMRERRDRAEKDLQRAEREAEKERELSEQEIREITLAYSKLEKVVTAHLKGLQRVLSEPSIVGNGPDALYEGVHVTFKDGIPLIHVA